MTLPWVWHLEIFTTKSSALSKPYHKDMFYVPYIPDNDLSMTSSEIIATHNRWPVLKEVYREFDPLTLAHEHYCHSFSFKVD